MNSNSQNPNDIKQLVDAVEYGFDKDAATSLIKYFNELFKSGLFENHQLTTDEKSFIRYIDRAFGLIAEGKRADVALGLDLGKGDYEREDTTRRDLVMAAYITKLRRDSGEVNTTKRVRKDGKVVTEIFMKPKLSVNDAAAIASVKYYAPHGGDATAKAAYHKYRDALVGATDDWLNKLLDEADKEQQ